MRKLPYEDRQEIQDVLNSNKTIQEKVDVIYTFDYDQSCLYDKHPEHTMNKNVLVDILKERQCLYHKPDDSCRMEEGGSCRHHKTDICALHGDLSNGRNVKTQYELENGEQGFIPKLIKGHSPLY